ncbi:DUF1365 domain-containing protein [Aestuariivirga litoralis]|uniref:DUF1365 domain-containing protein n=1 Tax=Aestuariivirga litoralis TaxID=2650924 RepID=A0A2W2BAQ3_9HYPH|nr:DUF1365 domain-containing protein [Aestuariivirga litoralis]PZF77364.1 DUF1365 domain-containing protein [Aestuariivirga litoralis]
MPETCLYHGEVVHRRLSPLRHQLRYRVYNILADVDRLDELARSCRLFSYNRLNLFSIMDRNHGPGDGTPVREHAWSLVRAAEGGEGVRRIFMFCYPSVLGYVFNPLTVYYGVDAQGRLRLMIYEVNNTFGGRHSYVLPVKSNVAQQSAPKHFFVSPFNAVEGRYLFNFTLPEERIALGVALTVGDKPVLKAYVSGQRKPLTDANLLRSFLSIPLLTLKVIGAIHLHALKLWWKGLKLNRRPRGPNHTVDFLPEAHSQP